MSEAGFGRMKAMVGGVVFPVFVLAAAMATAQTETIKLTSLDLKTMTSGWKPAAVNQSVGERPLTVGGVVYAEGVGVLGPSVYELEVRSGEVLDFTALVGCDDSFPEAKLGSVDFRVYADGREVARSPRLVHGQGAVELKAGLKGAKSIVLAVRDGGDDSQDDLADWIDARFTVTPGTVLAPIEPEDAAGCQFGILTPPAAAAPAINPPRVFGVRPNHPILFRLPVSGVRPLKLAVAGLPKGATFDPATGMLGGSVAEKGDYELVFTAANAHGSTSEKFRLVVGDKIALTPPMGWSSWNVYGKNICESNILATARVLASSPLADYGWSYLNFDDCWTHCQVDDTNELADVRGAARDAEGRIRVNRRFPDLPALVAKLHALGLKAGVYSSPGPLTCCKCTGSFGHEEQDAATFAEWGFDFLKYDWCSAGGIAVGNGHDFYAAPYRKMALALLRQDRDIVYNICQYGMDRAPAWGAAVGGNSFRVSCDIRDEWKALNDLAIALDGVWRYAGPGAWNDLDMMVIGWVGGWDSLPCWPTRLTPNEQYSHVTIWSIAAVPMILGCDLTRLDDFTLNLITNPEVIEVNQDPLGAGGACVAGDRLRMHEEVWARPLADGAVALAVVNDSSRTRTIRVDLRQLGLRGEWAVRDLWRRRDEGTVTDEFIVTLPVHAPKFVKLVPLQGAGFAPGVTDIRERSWQRLYDDASVPAASGRADCPDCR